ncbi:MAG TPA: tRNA uridine-5-carboxymethylaminomethyl(34) synthesis GTPase MnmE, partial [Steroidobacteraceae bacterium]|nr:tRNA uridine-5-carboxymethylaminomethyl(34) synthesis GTPase MnmE [Steroidobacteraceae bacterium]
MSHPDTIVAAATPPGRGGIGIVRLSGAKTPEIAAVILGELPVARRATLARFADADNQTIDVGLALFFPAPHSYTGEHMLELQGHGGPLVIESLITRIQDLGARRALPGEFTQRAFLNDKLDLTQAEAICDLIDAGSSEAARAAMRSLQGEFSAMVHGLTEGVVEVRTHVEAAIDFPDEDIDPLANRQVQDRLQAVLQHFAAIEQSARQGRLLRDGMTVVLAGPPNAGKSSLLNRLAGYDAAIVTPHPGTTRDVLRERIHIDGMPLHVLDTAGLRTANDVAEEEGIRRARAEMARADRVLFVIDAADDGAGSSYVEARPHLPRGVPVTLLFNKCDLARGIPLDDTVSGPPRIAVSALTGAGLDAL